MDPRVVVVVPCHREPVDAVAASLASALAIPDLRVVVVDDGADRADLDALSDDRVRILHRRENGGPSAALEDGIASTAPGSVICRLDVRDEFYPEAKARQIETVLRGVQASCSPHFDPMLGRSHELPSNWRQHIYTDSCFTTVTAVYQRSVWERVGMDTSLRWAEDWRWALLVEHTIALSEQAAEPCAQALWPALQAGLVLPLGETYKFAQSPELLPQARYRFLHDRVQQAAHELTPAAEQAALQHGSPFGVVQEHGSAVKCDACSLAAELVDDDRGTQVEISLADGDRGVLPEQAFIGAGVERVHAASRLGIRERSPAEVGDIMRARRGKDHGLGREGVKATQQPERGGDTGQQAGEFPHSARPHRQDRLGTLAGTRSGSTVRD